MAGGSRMARKCIRQKYPAGSLEIHVPQLFCPVRSFWGGVSVAWCAQVNSSSQNSQGQGTPISAGVRRDASDGTEPTDSELTALGGVRLDRFRKPAAALRSCFRRASGAPPHIACTRMRRARGREPWLPSLLKPQTTKGRGDRGHGEKGFPYPRRLGPE